MSWTFHNGIPIEVPDDEGGVIESPTWPDGCALTLNELAHPGEGHIDHDAELRELLDAVEDEPTPKLDRLASRPSPFEEVAE